MLPRAPRIAAPTCCFVARSGGSSSGKSSYICYQQPRPLQCSPHLGGLGHAAAGAQNRRLHLLLCGPQRRLQQCHGRGDLRAHIHCPLAPLVLWLLCKCITDEGGWVLFSTCIGWPLHLCTHTQLLLPHPRAAATLRTYEAEAMYRVPSLSFGRAMAAATAALTSTPTCAAAGLRAGDQGDDKGLEKGSKVYARWPAANNTPTSTSSSPRSCCGGSARGGSW